MNRRSLLSLSALFTALPLLTGCPITSAGGGAQQSFDSVTQVQLQAGGGTSLVVGGTSLVTATALDQNVNAVPNVVYTWTVGGQSIEIGLPAAGDFGDSLQGGATVMVRAKRIGTSQLTAQVHRSNGGTITQTLTFDVQDNVGGVTLTGPSEATLGGELEFAIAATDANGGPIEGSNLFLSSSDTDVLENVGPTKLRAVGIGTVQVRAGVNGSGVMSAPLAVSVKPAALAISPGDVTIAAGGSTTLALTISGTGGAAPKAVRIVPTWTANPSNVVTIGGSATGAEIFAGGGGTATVTAELLGVTATATVRVPTIASVELAGDTSALTAGDSRTFTAVAKDPQGNVLPNASFSWSFNGALTGTPSGATFTATGTGIGGGQLTATAGEKTGSAFLNVVPASVNLTSTATALVPGQTATLTAQARNRSGATLPIGDVSLSFTSSNGSVAVQRQGVSNLATATANNPGTANVTATVAGVASNALAITVHQITSITLSGDSSPLNAGNTRAVTATVNTSSGTVSGFTLSWSDPTGVATIVDSIGQQATIRGEILGKTGVVAQLGLTQSAPFEVVTRPATVELSPANPSVGVGSTANVAATAKDSLGRILTGTGLSGDYTWSSADGAIATVAPVNPGSANAVITGAKGGATTVSATWSSDFDAGVTVASGPITVTVNASPAPVFPTSGSFSAGYTDPTHYALSFPAATDVGTPQASLTYEIYASTDAATLFDGAPRVTLNGGADPVTGTLDVSGIGGANPGWLFGVKARDGEGQTSAGAPLTLVAEANPDPAQTVLFTAGTGIFSVTRTGGVVKFHGSAVDASQAASTLERTGARPGPAGSLAGLFIGGDGAQYLFHRTGAAALSAVGAAITTDRGGCAAAQPRPIVALPATAGGGAVVVYSVTDGFLPCEQATLVMRPVAGGADVFLASGVRAAAVAGSSKVVFIRGKLLFLLDLDTLTEAQLSATGGDLSGQLLFADASTAWSVQPGTGALTSFDLTGVMPSAGTSLTPILTGARGGYALGAGLLAVEDAAGALRIVDTADGSATTLLAPSTIGAARLLLGAGN